MNETCPDRATNADMLGVADTGTWWATVARTAETALPKFLCRQRWFPAKDAGEPTVSLVCLIPLFPESVRAAVALWKVAPSRGESFVMLVPLAVVAPDTVAKAETIATISDEGRTGGSLALVEAFGVDEFVRHWISLHVLDPVPESRLSIGRMAGLNGVGLDSSTRWVIRRLGVDQSNTSIRVGEHAILKVIRKVEEGVHPELEMSRYLTGAGFPATPALLGWSETAAAPERGSFTLSLLQAFAVNQGDGWRWVLERLGRAIMGPDPGAFEEIRGWLAVLARRTAQMHRVLARDTAHPAFNPEVVSPADLSRWAGSAQKMADGAIRRLNEGAGRLTPDAAGLALEVAKAGPALSRRLSQLTQTPPTWSKTRHHGDFHLGQTLVVDADAVILDFEGEPLRAIAERRAKHCVVRDVAGMMRSLAYVAHAAGRALPAHMRLESRRAAEQRLNAWRDESSRAFADAYFQSAAGNASIPDNPSDAQRILRFFLLEKALYEMTYEMANRPDWIEIPLRGVLDELQAS
ncbi:MAG: malQ [Gammaproteobacteria bacterium]|nr:malQ [Gammaproteobacteria bacterium]